MPKAYQDKEDTDLYGCRAGKDSLRVEAIGNIDELNSFAGLAVSRIEDSEMKGILKEIQSRLFATGADLATPPDAGRSERITGEDVKRLEEIIIKIESELPPLARFILPGGSEEAALLHACRTVCRRAERSLVALKKKEEINNFAFVYVNRLSDLFFALARTANRRKGVNDEEWK